MYDDLDNCRVENPVKWQTKLSKRVAHLIGHIHILKEFDRGRLSERNPIFRMRIAQAKTCVREEAALLMAELADCEGQYVISLVTFLADAKKHIDGWSDVVEKSAVHVKAKVGGTEAETLRFFK